MSELGWFDDKRVELIDGEIIEMPVQKAPHSMAILLARGALEAAFGPGHVVRTQAPLDLDPSSEPEPDVAVVPGSVRDYVAHPKTALLVVEVSETTLWLDRTRKAPLYARAGLAEFWIVNLVDRQLEVHRDPVADAAQPLGFRYASVSVLGPPDFVCPLAAPAARVAVADLLP
jgi:Uma2 family endonuclease